ncbi:MAG: MerR family transcriptional regulator [Nannocystales bacterium]
MTTSAHISHRMKVGELARMTGKTVRALRLYEEMGLLQPKRSEGNYRLYGADEVARVYWIAKLQALGFSLPQIQGLLETVESSSSGPDAMQSLRENFRGRLADTRAQVEKLLQLERDLSESLAYLEGCRACSHEHLVDGCVSCDGVHSDTEAPSLVAGIHSPTTGRSTSAVVQIRSFQDPSTP